MKRDMEVIRTILLRIEQDDQLDGAEFGRSVDMSGTDIPNRVFVYHCVLMDEAGLIDANVKMARHGDVVLDRLTWQGHEFLDAIRDPDIWGQTKAAADKVEGFGLDLFKALAKGFLKKQIEDRTGVKLDL